jgi:hypothetical protein
VIDSTHRNYIINGLLRIEFARQKSLKRETNENGFEMTGIYPFNMDKMIQNCKIPISDVERAIWANQLEPAKVLLKDNHLDDLVLRIIWARTKINILTLAVA